MGLYRILRATRPAEAGASLPTAAQRMPDGLEADLLRLCLDTCKWGCWNPSPTTSP